MKYIALILVLTVAAPMRNWKAEQVSSSAVEEHIREVIKELPPNSLLRGELLQGARGDGVHYPWMDDMQKEGIKRVVVWVDIRFDPRGRPKQMSVDRTQYFTEYDAGGAPVSETERLKVIRASGLENQLNNLALHRAMHGAWVDVPRPKPRPFVGRTTVEFLDDEWLPMLHAPIYSACETR
ncbi:MAG: hypothetical protein WA755_00370 [Candidatus Acidiferrales bacterium]